jgi:hypothetical protein
MRFGGRPRLRVLLRMVVGITVSSFVLEPAAASGASARTGEGCGLALLRDWADGRIEETYAASCYRDAVRRMPEDLRLYSTAVEDIRAAAARTLRRMASAGSRTAARDEGAEATALEEAGGISTDTMTVVAAAIAGLLAVGVSLVAVSALRDRRTVKRPR